jgi:hypothetical protein
VRDAQEGTKMGRPEELALIPITLREANAFVELTHRHHGRVIGARFAVGLAMEKRVRGVVIVGRPVSRHLDDGWTAEVTRCCTDGIKNGCSMLYGAAWRACRALGYKRLITYTLQDEKGVSLRASGWKLIGEAGGGSWSREGRPRVDLHPLQAKLRWEVNR